MQCLGQMGVRVNANLRFRRPPSGFRVMERVGQLKLQRVGMPLLYLEADIKRIADGRGVHAKRALAHREQAFDTVIALRLQAHQQAKSAWQEPDDAASIHQHGGSLAASRRSSRDEPGLARQIRCRSIPNWARILLPISSMDVCVVLRTGIPS